MSREEWVSNTAPQGTRIQMLISWYGWHPVCGTVNTRLYTTIAALTQLPGSKAFPKTPAFFLIDY